MTNPTPTELSRLHTEGSVRVVRKCEPQPVGVFKGHPVWRDSYFCDVVMEVVYYETPMFEDYSPFPPAGTVETIDGVRCVWDEVECKKLWEIIRDHGDEVGLKKTPDYIENDTDYFFTATTRKDETE